MYSMKYIQVLYKAYEIFLNKISVEYGLTVTEIKILVFLNDNNEESNLARDIVNTYLIAKSYVSTSVTSLDEKKYIERIQDKNDRKRIHLKITNAGMKIIKEIEPKVIEFKEELLKGISQEDINCTRNSLIKIAENARNMDIILA